MRVLALILVFLNTPLVQAASAPWSQYFGTTGADDHLEIAAGQTVQIDQCTLAFASLTVRGRLTTLPGLPSACPHVRIEARTIVVTGTGAQIAIGSAAVPYGGHLELILTGDPDLPGIGMAEQRQIMIMAGARLELHGATAQRRSWSRLAQTVQPGAQELRMADATRWRSGDRIVIASSTIDPRESEIAIVAWVADGGRRIGLEAPLQFAHFGEMQHFGGKRLDTRAEVGLLSHSILIRGDDQSVVDGLGGNIMIMNRSMERPIGHPAELLRPNPEGPASAATLSGVELKWMGQRGRAGRYAIHWHLVDDGRDSWIRDSSIHHGFQRAVNIHGTDQVTVERVVGYHVENHMFVPSEEGDENRNRFIDNLGILALPVVDDRFAFPSSSNPSRSDQSEHRIAVFWLRSSFNFLRGNHAAGAWRGQGFFFDHGGMNGRSKRYALEASGSDEMCHFRDNLAHSIYVGLGSPDWYTPLVRGFGLFSTGHQFGDRATTCTLRGFSAYKTQNGGMWLEDHTVAVDVIVADSHTGIIAGDRLDDIVVVGQTANNLPSGALPGKSELSTPDRSRAGFAQSNNGGQGIVGRHFTRLSCVSLPACFFAQVDGDDEVGQYEGAILDDVRLVDTAQGFSTTNGTPVFRDPGSISFGSFIDVDGALTGTAGTAGTLDAPEFLTIDQPPPSRWGWPWDETEFAPGQAAGPLLIDGFD